MLLNCSDSLQKLRIINDTFPSSDPTHTIPHFKRQFYEASRREDNDSGDECKSHAELSELVLHGSDIDMPSDGESTQLCPDPPVTPVPSSSPVQCDPISDPTYSQSQ